MKQSYWLSDVNEGPRSRRGKLRCLLHGIILEEIIGPNQEMKLKGGFLF